MRFKTIGIVVVGVLLCLATADVYSALHARSMAQRMLAQWQQELESSAAGSFAIKDVQMHWGVYSSSGTLKIAATGARNFEIPLKVDLSQGAALDGSVLRASLAVVLPEQDKALTSLLAALGDAQPVTAQMNVYLNGTRQVDVVFHPAHGVMTRGPRSVSVDWDGAWWTVLARHADSAESVLDMTAHQAPLQIKFGDQSVSIGAMDASSVQNGWNTNMRSTGSLTLGPVQVGGFAMRQLSYSAAMQARLKDEGAGQPNPSGMSGLGMIVTLQNLSAQFDEPPGQMRLSGHVTLQGPPDLKNLPMAQRHAATLQWLRTGDLDLHVTFSQDLLNAMPPPLQNALGSLIQRGALTLQQGSYVSELVFRQGRLTMNGVQMG